MERHSENKLPKLDKFPVTCIYHLIAISNMRLMASLHVEPQDVAILTTMITVSSTGRPTLLFYVQKDNTFVSVSTVSSALEVSKHVYV